MNRLTLNRLFVNGNLYHYAGIWQRSDSELQANNPVKYTDPDGRIINLSSNVTAGNGLKQSQTDASIVKRTAGLFLIGLGLLLDYGSPLITGLIVYSSGGTTVAPAINVGSKALGKTLELAAAILYLTAGSHDSGDSQFSNSDENSKNRKPASEKCVRDMAQQIEKDLGKEARRDFHDMKDGAGGDRTIEELKNDAQFIYDIYGNGKSPPNWMKPD